MAAPSPDLHRGPPLLTTLVILSGLSALSTNIFLPSLPGMARDFNVDYAVMQLTVSAYLAASAVVQLLAGPISDRLGRRPVMLGSLGIFLVATAGCLLAPTAGLFLACRMVQAAVTAGMVIPRAVIRDTAPADRAASMIGYVTMGMSVVPMLAPAIGGVLDEAFGWQASFLMLAAIGIGVTIWTWRDMGETARDDGIGFRAMAAGYPVLMRSARYWGYVGAATFASGTFFAYLGGAPFVGLEVFHMTPAQVGYWFMAPSVGYLLGNFTAGRYSARVGLDRMILAGSAITLAALSPALIVSMGGTITPAVFFGAIAVTGIGNGMVLPNANAGMMSVIPDLAGTAAGLGSALMVAGGAALATLAGALLMPGTGATPLLAIMTASAAAALAAISLTRRA